MYRSFAVVSLWVGAAFILQLEVQGVWLWLRIGGAVLLLLAGLYLWQGRKNLGAEEVVTAAVRRRRLDVVAAGMLVAAVVALVTVIVGGVEQTEVFARAGATSVFTDKKGAADNPAKGGDALWNEGMQRELSKQSDHKLKNYPELFLEILTEGAESLLESERVYLRGFTFSEFDGARWKVAERFKKVHLPQGEGTRLQLSESLAEHPIVEYQVRVAPNSQGQNLLYVLPEVRDVALPRLTEVAEDVFLLPEGDGGLLRYTAQSQLLGFEVLERRGEKLSVGEAEARYLQTDSAGWNAEQLAELLGDLPAQSTLLEKLDFIRRVLRERCTYSLAIRNVREVGAMENFLFGEKVGYCEHFASAAALLCRELGIPSRMAYGYAGGVYYPAQGVQVFRARDAHAWTEVFVQGYGWVVFDTTPEEGVVPERAPASAGLPSLEKKENLTKVVESVPPWWLPLAYSGGVVGVILLATGSLFFWKSRRHAQQRKLSGKARKPLEYFAQFQRVCAQVGIAQVESKSVRELVALLIAMGHDVEALNDLEAYHNGVLYRRAAREPKREERLRVAISEFLSDRKR